jgi:RNA polymerase sigma-70 factor (ECF subfamily)
LRARTLWPSRRCTISTTIAAGLAFLRPIEGGEHIAHAWAELGNRVTSTMTLLERTVNGQPGLVAQHDGVTVTVFAFEFAGDRIQQMWVIRNPDKLRPWTTS